MSTFILIDGLNLFFRAAYAMPRGDAFTKSGLGLHIILNSIKKAWKDFNGDHVVMCLDSKSWRYDLYPNYKASRKLKAANKSQKEKEEDEYLFEVFNDFIDFLNNKTNVTVLKEQGCEADDLIAHWIRLHPDDKNIILSGDSDFIQLLSNNVIIYDGKKEETYTIDGIYDKHGNKIPPKKEINPQWELFKKIVRGDSSDNIMSAYPGIRETKLKDAYSDKETKGYIWSNFMLQEWIDPNNNVVKVRDRYDFNKKLIDLHLQPDYIKDNMSRAIVQAASKERVTQVGVWLMKFCERHQLINIAKHPQHYSGYLSASYPTGE